MRSAAPLSKQLRPGHTERSLSGHKARVEEACAAHGLDSITVLVNGAVNAEDVNELLASPKVESVILREDQIVGTQDCNPRLGLYLPDINRWQLPRRLGRAVVVVGERIRPSLPMAVLACRKGVLSYYQPSITSWEKLSFVRAIGHRALRRAALKFLDWSRSVQVRSAAEAAPVGTRLLAASGLPAFGERLLVRTAERRAGRKAGQQELKLEEQPLLPKSAFLRNRVLMINSALAWGGAERQLVNTMIGLHERGYDTSLVCEAFGVVPDSEFFRWRLGERDLDAAQIHTAADDFAGEIPQDILDALDNRISHMPDPFRERIAPYALEMLARRPGVVHAWQDQTSVMAGVAAALVGVPRIILSTRNMSPPNFAYFQPHMRDTYRTLIGLSNVRIINNSRAGSADYAAWLDVLGTNFHLLYNGIDFDLMKTPNRQEASEYRKRLGIGADQQVIGSIFRLYVEKDPVLWLETAALVAKGHRDAVFVIIGVGPMREELLEMARQMGMDGRLMLPGTEKRPEFALSIMDAFLLTSRFEGLPNVIIEAQSQGVPVVTTRAGGSAEAIEPGVTGWLVEERDAARLAERVSYVLDNPDWTKSARARARLFAQERFGLERMIDETISIYESVSGH